MAFPPRFRCIPFALGTLLVGCDPGTVTGVASLNAPTGLQALGGSGSDIELSWSDTNDRETGYEIERANGGDENFVVVATTTANAEQHIDSGLSPGRTYSYRVRAVEARADDQRGSAYSEIVTATTLGDAALCGNGMLDLGESCDPQESCPTTCSDGNACTTDVLTGDSETCSARCRFTSIDLCADDDGCCPSGCSSANDNDCSATCDDGVIDDGETCDPPGSCPTECNDGNSCTVDGMTGSAETCNAACTHAATSACANDDDCCPAGCDSSVDNDCSISCGNDLVEEGETCDPPGTCPISCDDGNSCTIDQLTGSAASCSAACSTTEIVSCADDDGCCPNGCTPLTDNNCASPCGDGICDATEDCASCVADCGTCGCESVGSQRVAVLLYTHPGHTPTVTAEEVRQIFFGTDQPSLKTFWEEVSFGQMSVSGDVFGWYTLADEATSCDRSLSHADPDVDFSQYNRVFILDSCGGASGSMGCSNRSSDDGSFLASRTHLNADYLPDGLGLITHEGGHNLGLEHANGRSFGAEPLGPIGDRGTVSTYADPTSVMGGYVNNTPHYSAKHKTILGWMAPQVVDSNGTFTIRPLEIVTAEPQALKVRRGTGTDAWLWIEYRQPVGLFDILFASQPALTTGAVIHYEDSITTDIDSWEFGDDHFIAGWPGSNYTLQPGTTWNDPYSDLILHVDEATAAGLTVTISYELSSFCQPHRPTVSVSPSSFSVPPGGSFSLTATITNTDSGLCAATEFRIRPAWYLTYPLDGFAPQQETVTLSPGETTTVDIAFTVRASAYGGSFQEEVAAERSWNENYPGPFLGVGSFVFEVTP